MKRPVKKYNNGGPVTTTKTTTKKPAKTVSQTIGDITLRDVKNAGESALQITTLGGYGKTKEALGGNKFKFKKIGEKKYGGKMKKVKSGTKMMKAGGSTNENNSSFAKLAPPFNKATFADKIAGAKANAGTAKSGAKMKMGGKMAKQAAIAIAMKRAGKTPKKAMNGYGGAAASMVPPMKKGGVVKKAGMHKMPDGSMMKNSAMKSGGKMTKCKYGCN